MLATKKQIREKIREVSSSVAAAVLGIGAGLTISIIFTKIGVWFVVLGGVIFTTGRIASNVVPGFFKYQLICCPFCRETTEVKENAADYSCENCGKNLEARNNGKIRRGHLELVVNNVSKTAYAKPGTLVPKNIGPQKKGNC